MSKAGRVTRQGRHRRVRSTYMQRRLGVSLTLGLVALVFAALAGCAAPEGGVKGPPAGSVTPKPGAKATPKAGPAVAVTKVVDGDTIKVPGATVRLIGVDTPERGQCGYRPAKDRVQSLVGGRDVVLTAVKGRDDHDRYGRLLRYVSVGGADVGLTLIQEGLGIARYDSRDGYGTHPKQSEYVKTDAATPAKGCAS